MIEVLLLEPRKQENLGAVARAMKNFDFYNLVLINPKCKIGIKARKVAKHAQTVLDNAKIKPFSYVKNFDHLIGTTAILGTDYNIPRNPIDITQLSSKISKISKKKIGLLIGRETIGLKNEELDFCDILVTVPASKKYPTLNISHSVAIMLYEIFKKISHEKSNSHINFATKKEQDIISDYINSILNKLDFSTKEKKATQKKVWKRILGKALLTKREAFAIMGFLRKLK
tara:strand:- start:17 stop:703 length:687 start_codon:yes stop_codon:yes gene_type:complete